MKKIVALLLASLILLTIIACSGRGTGETTTTNGNTTELKKVSNVEAKDYDGYGFVFADTETKGGFDHQYPEIFAEVTSSESVGAAVYKRNDIIQAKYNIEIISNTEIDLYSTLSANDDICDAICYGPYQSKPSLQAGYLLDLNDYSDVFNFNEDWWWGSISDGISINNKLYQMTGDANIRSLASVNCMFFNKEVLDDYAGGIDLYALVNNNEWTFEKMLEIAKPVGADVDGDSQYTEKDRYGFAINNFATIAYFYGCGCRFVTKNATSGELEYDFGSEKQVEVLTKIVELLNDTKYTLYGEKYKNTIENGRVLIGQEVFADNRALFAADLISRGILMRSMEKDFGILPVPKYDEKQENYIGYLHGNASYMSIPVTVTDADRSARVIEDMTFYSSDTVRSAYIDNLVKEKFTRDEESKKMVDIIYDYVIFDMGYFGIGSMDGDLRGMADNNDTNFASFFKSKSKVWERTLDAYLKSFNSD